MNSILTLYVPECSFYTLYTISHPSNARLNSRRSSRDSSGHAIGDPELSPKSVFLVKTSQGSLAV